MKKIKLLLATALIGTTLTTNILPVVAYAGDMDSIATTSIINQIDTEKLTLDQAIANTINYYRNHNKNLDSWWQIVALTGVGEDIKGAPYTIPVWDENTVTTDTYVGDDTGVIIGLIAKGEDPKDFHGKNFAEIVSKKQKQFPESFNGANFNMWAIIALEMANQEYDKEFALKTLLEYQMDDGGFGFSKVWGSSTDMTGMALISLSMLQKDEAFKNDSRIKESINKALNYLEVSKLEDGTFIGYGSAAASDANSTAMAITGLLSVGEDLTSERWSGVNTGLLSMQVTEKDEAAGNGIKGQFFWQKPTANELATNQSLIAIGDLKSQESIWSKLDTQYENYEAGKENLALPKIVASDIVVNVGDNINLMEGVKAEDTNGKDLTSKVIIKKNNIQSKANIATKAGNYSVTYEVVDSEGRNNLKTIEVTVKEREDINLTVIDNVADSKKAIEKIEAMLNEVDKDGKPIYNLEEKEAVELDGEYMLYTFIVRKNSNMRVDNDKWEIRMVLSKNDDKPVIDIPEVKPVEDPEKDPVGDSEKEPVKETEKAPSQEENENKTEMNSTTNPSKLPQTGGQGTLPVAIAGITAVIAGLGIKLKRK